MSAPSSKLRNRRPRGSVYLEPATSKALLLQIRKALGGMGYEVYKGIYDSIMTVNDRATESVSDLRSFVEHHHAITELHNQLATTQNEVMKKTEAADEDDEEYKPIIYFPVVGDDEEGDAMSVTSSFSEMDLDDLEAIRTSDPGPQVAPQVEPASHAQNPNASIKLTHEQIEECVKSGKGSMHLEGLSEDDYRKAQVLPAWDPGFLARQTGALFTYSDGYTINGNYPPEHYLYPDEMGEGTWEEGAQAIEDFDWS